MVYIGSDRGSSLRQIGVATAPRITGPWLRPDKPLALGIESDANNPSVAFGPGVNDFVRVHLNVAVPGSNVTFTVNTQNGTAIAGQDYVAIVNQNFTITGGANPGDRCRQICELTPGPGVCAGGLCQRPAARLD